VICFQERLTGRFFFVWGSQWMSLRFKKPDLKHHKTSPILDRTRNFKNKSSRYPSIVLGLLRILFAICRYGMSWQHQVRNSASDYLSTNRLFGVTMVMVA